MSKRLILCLTDDNTETPLIPITVAEAAKKHPKLFQSLLAIMINQTQEKGGNRKKSEEPKPEKPRYEQISF